MAKHSAARLKKPSPSEGRLLPPPGHLTVRMYRQGLGDCFLIAIGSTVKADPRYILIDCGVHFRQGEGSKRIGEVMENVVAATGGNIHVVVATHEHADHLSGFIQKGSPFLDNRLKIDQLWVAWTEKAGDDQADLLRKKRGASREAIQRAVEKLHRSNVSMSERIHGILDFEALPAGTLIDPKLAAAGRAKLNPSISEIALGFLKQNRDKVHYCEPGELLRLEGLDDFRAFVLGPPRKMEALKRDLPTQNAGANRETYLTARAQHQTYITAPGLDEESGGAIPWVKSNKVHDDVRHPFEEMLRRRYWLKDDELSPKWAEACTHRTRKFFLDNYFESFNWRRIDSEWMTAAEQLALDLDSDTNNTSLALAFEWGDPGQGDVLLFAADAQVGNWLSWRDQTYRVGAHSLSVDNLLSRTILYKVGHHGSHNATLRLDPSRLTETYPNGVPFGLELMPSRLIAMISVDREAAQKPMPRPWHMPHPPMYRRLLERSSGRVLRSDGPTQEPGTGDFVNLEPNGSLPMKVPGLTRAKWCEAPVRFQHGRRCPLYYDLSLERGSQF